MKEKSLLLVICPCWGVMSAPLSIGSLGSYLQNKGHQVDLYDANIETYHRVDDEMKKLWDMTYSALWWNMKMFYEDIRPKFEQEILHAAYRIANNNADIIGFSVYAPNRYYTRELIRVLNTMTKKEIIIGGRGINEWLERKIFSDVNIDGFVVGEGEEVLDHYLTQTKSAKEFFSDDNVCNTTYINDVTSLPMVTYEGLDLSQYTQRAVTLLLSRGCCFRCAFCNDWRYMGCLRTKEPNNVFEEIEYHIEKNSIYEVNFNDQAINANQKALQSLCELLIRRDANIKWTAAAIPWRQLTLDLLKLMKEAGCFTLNFGVETGSDEVLQRMNKKLIIADIEKVLKDTYSVGINTMLNFIVGFPGETEEDFKKTKEFVARNTKYISGIGNVNMCNATFGSDLIINRDKYEIVLPEDPSIQDSHWYTHDGKNTFEIRRQRLNELIKVIEQQELVAFSTNSKQADGKSKFNLSIFRKESNEES